MGADTSLLPTGEDSDAAIRKVHEISLDYTFPAFLSASNEEPIQRQSPGGTGKIAVALKIFQARPVFFGIERLLIGLAAVSPHAGEEGKMENEETGGLS
jgi:hypothetical protein